MLCAKLGWKWPSGCGKEDYKKFSTMDFNYFAIIPTLKTWIIFTQGCCVPSLVENGPMVLEKKILKSSQCIFTISKLFPLWEVCGPSFEQKWIPFNPCSHLLVHAWTKSCPQTDRQTATRTGWNQYTPPKLRLRVERQRAILLLISLI